MLKDLPLNYEDHPQALALPNPFAPYLLRLDQHLAAETFLGSLSPLQRLAQDGAPGWWCYGHSRMIGSLRVSSLVACGTGEGTSQGHDGLTVVLNYGGEIGLDQGGVHWCCLTGDCVVLPGSDLHWSGGPASLVVLVLEPDRMVRSGTAMAGLNDPPTHWTRQLQQGRGWRSVGNGFRPTLQQVLRQVLRLGNDLADISSALVDRLTIDELIHGLVAALLFEDLRREEPLERLQQRERTGRDGFDELLAFIRQHLDQPLNLTALEGQLLFPPCPPIRLPRPAGLHRHPVDPDAAARSGPPAPDESAARSDRRPGGPHLWLPQPQPLLGRVPPALPRASFGTAA